MEPLISVVIPAYNSGAYLQPAIDSVLAEQWPRLEVVVVDDGSSDGTPEAAESYGVPVVVIRHGRRGHPAARNTGVRTARGEFLAFLDHDDLWAAGRLAKQVKCFRDDPDLDLVFGHIQNFFSEELGPEETSRLRVPLMPLPGLLQGAMLARRSSFDRVGPFDESRTIGDFIDWYGRAMIAGLRTRMLPETVLYRRVHRTNHQRVYRDGIKAGYLSAVRQLLVRRRDAGGV